jgi:TRAP-type C4-dicarboxylate transport system permease large subunit
MVIYATTTGGLSVGSLFLAGYLPGAVLFIGSGIAKRPMEKVVKEMLPFYAFMVIALLLITFIPAISLGIPWALGYGK